MQWPSSNSFMRTMSSSKRKTRFARRGLEGATRHGARQIVSGDEGNRCRLRSSQHLDLLDISRFARPYSRAIRTKRARRSGVFAPRASSKQHSAKLLNCVANMVWSAASMRAFNVSSVKTYLVCPLATARTTSNATSDQSCWKPSGITAFASLRLRTLCTERSFALIAYGGHQRSELWPMRQFGPRNEHATCGPMQAQLDLLIRAALLANLPRSGSVWPEQDVKSGCGLRRRCSSWSMGR